MKTAEQIVDELIALGNQKTAAHSQRFFKTGKDEYGEGDHFLGIRVPVLRKLSRQYRQVSLAVIEHLISSQYHEVRLLAVYILVLRFEKAKAAEQQKAIVDFYLQHLEGVNNWDLVDSSAHYILGAFLFDKDKQLLYEMARSANLWKRRIAIMSTFYFIKKGEFEDALALSKILLNDAHDLIHKAVGWMLREIGKREKSAEENFLLAHYHTMPRTMLRYAIEKFPKEERKAYLKGLK